MPSELKLLGRAIALTYIGDSHAGTVGTLSFAADEAQYVSTVSQQIRGLMAADFLGEDGAIVQSVMDILRSRRALLSNLTAPAVKGFRPVLVRHDTGFLRENLCVTSFANDDAYIFCVGELDARHLLHKVITEDVDFELPFKASGIERLTPAKARRTYSAGEMVRLLADRLQPLFIGLRMLKAAGLRSIFLHSIPPPTPDDEDFFRVFNFRSIAATRYKLHLLINYIYEVMCRDIGVGFINTWPMVTVANVLDDRYYLDGVHLNHQHAVLSATEAYRQFIGAKTSA